MIKIHQKMCVTPSNSIQTPILSSDIISLSIEKIEKTNGGKGRHENERICGKGA